MSKKPGSIFSVANTRTAQISVKIPQKLKEDMDNIDKQLEQLDSKLKFDRATIVEEALSNATTKAKKELESMKKMESTSELA